MDPAVAAVRLAVRESLDLVAGGLVLAAVSGGPDSMALAAALAAEAPKRGLRAGAVTVDHGLQEGSAERAGIVASACKELGLDPVEIATVSVDRHGGPEAAARTARYAALDAVADRLDAAAIAVGHTLDDQAETVLLGLARGSGARSLSGMAPRRGRVIRPLLRIRRETTVRACRALGIASWEDPHNLDPAFTRVRVRAEAMPALEAALGPGVPEALARTARMLRDDADALDAWASSVTDVGDVAALQALPAAVRTRVLRRAAINAGVPAGALTAAHVEDIDALVTAWRGQRAVSLPGGLEAYRSYDRLSFR
ncbi:MAG TPA: tRNA lysidine(34) synthetase TilS [Mycobacteriales bacterium]|nr:tRNA lysidine(34) synthetase TilS [Mycobacteriales bacterium]